MEDSEKLLEKLKKQREKELEPIDLKWLKVTTTHGELNFPYTTYPRIENQSTSFLRIKQFHDPERTKETDTTTVIYTRNIIKSEYQIEK